MTLSVETLVHVTGGELLSGNPELMLNGVCTDSRSVHSGSAYVAFSGQRVDGHDFLVEAIGSGARALVVTRPEEELAAAIEAAALRGVAVVRVADPLVAVQDLAAHHRGRLFCPVIGVTGSTGKTTTKEFITAVLGMDRTVVATRGNRNNELGVPLTILDAGADTDVLVVEMAMRGAGQIAELCRIAQPTVGLVTNVGTSHIEILGSQEAIASAKGELVEAIPEEGVTFLNGDDAHSDALAISSGARVLSYGLADQCDVRATDIELDSASRATFTLCAPDVSIRVSLTLPGRHNVYNALAAAAVALYVGVPVDLIAEGLASADAGEMRMQTFATAGGTTVINDAYNANPVSMRAAVDTLAGFTLAKRRIAVLGDMAELGSLSEVAHFEVGEQVARADTIHTLVTVGPRAVRIADGAKAAGMDPGAVRPCVTPEEASEVLDDLLEQGDVVLVKASRVMGLELIVEGIVDPRV